MTVILKPLKHGRAPSPILEAFATELARLNPAPDRVLNVAQTSQNTIFVNFYNLPIAGFKGGAEAENNRAMFSVYVHGIEVRIEESTSVFDRTWRLRAKRGTPEKIAAYFAGHIAKVAAQVAPKFTSRS